MAAMGLALGHHAFYNHLNSRPPPETSYNILSGFLPQITGQQINTSIGVFLATLVKSFLCIAVGSAHDQLSWRAVKLHPTELGLIDSLFSSKTGISDIFDLRLWRRYPTVMVLAVLYWLIPFSAVVAPATLSIVTAPVLNSTILAVPIPDFGNENLASAYASAKSDNMPSYEGYLAPMTRVVSQSILRGNVVPMAAPFPNATYNVAFPGPALRCNDVVRNTSFWAQQTAQMYNASRYYQLSDGHEANIRYLAWAGAPEQLPWHKINGRIELPPKDTTPGGIPLSFTVLTMVDGANSIDGNISMINCGLWNVSYSVDIIYEQGEQSVTSQIMSYDKALKGIQTPHSESPGSYTVAVEQTPTWIYMAILETFQTYVLGSVIEDWTGNKAFTTMVDTDIGLTVLPFTSALGYIQSSIIGLNASDYSQDDLVGGRNLSTKDALNDMFRNLTVSLMSEPALMKVKYTNVTTNTYQNVYAYSPSLLWAIYGISIGTTVVSVILGCAVATIAQGGYSMKFSTNLRVVSNIRLSDAIHLEDTAGKDPLPARLEKTLVYFPPDGVSALLDGKQGIAQEEDGDSDFGELTSVPMDGS
ncbi:hypothetical protein F5Y16DRAFT_384914 [Xylariaceae sp. FL0255]|nr:hypothetical protein F5Y16DRAFT_384914 [Xylariaceae sp. FL0255]